jgi:hypothetical protein
MNCEQLLPGAVPERQRSPVDPYFALVVSVALAIVNHLTRPAHGFRVDPPQSKTNPSSLEKPQSAVTSKPIANCWQILRRLDPRFDAKP